MKKTNPPSATKNRLVLILVILLASVITGLVIWISFDNELDALSKRTDKDFITETYVVEQVFERQISDNGQIKYRYDFIKPAGETFNLSLPIKISDTGNYSNEISIGDSIEVKVYSSELEEMRSGSILRKLQRFMLQDNREVEVYKLNVNGNTLFEKDIKKSDVNFRKGGDLSVFPIFIILFALVAAVYIFASIKKKFRTQKK